MITPERVAELVGWSNATILEIGANGGQDTRKLARQFNYGHIFAFEPDPRAAQRFRENVTEKNVFLFEVAVGKIAGIIDFYQSGGSFPLSIEDKRANELPEDWDLSGSIRKPKEHLAAHPWCTFDTTISVPIVTLDAWALENRIGHVDFIWADVQGAEEDLIVGAQAVLSRTKYFYTEFSDEEMYEGEIGLKQISNLLPEFEIVEKFRDEVLMRNRKFNVSKI